MNRLALNRDRLSRCAAAEMRYFDDIAARTRLLWSVLTLTGVSLLFCAVYYLNESRAPQHLISVWVVGGLFAAYVALCFVRRRTSSRGASSFLTAMVFTVLSLLVTAAVSFLLFRAAWYWEFQGFIPGGAVRLMRGLLSRCLWAPLAVVVLNIVLWFVPVGDAPIRGTRLYLVTVWLPLLPPVGIFLLTFFRDAVAQSKAARALTVLYLSLCFALAVHYLVKAAAYLILAHSTPDAEPQPARTPEWASALTARLHTLLEETRAAVAAKLRPAEETPAEEETSETPVETPAETPADEAPAPAETPAEDAPQPKPKKPRKKKTAPKTDAETPAETPADEAPAPAEAPAEDAPQPKPKKPRRKKTAPKTDAETPAEIPADEAPAPAEAPAEETPQPKPKKPRKKKTAPKADAETPADEAPAPADPPAEDAPQPKPKKPRKKKTAPKADAETPAQTPADEAPAPAEVPAEDAPQPKPKKPRKKKTAPKADAEASAEGETKPE